MTNDIHQEYDPQESIYPGMRARHALDEVLEDIASSPAVRTRTSPRTPRFTGWPPARGRCSPERSGSGTPRPASTCNTT